MKYRPLGSTGLQVSELSLGVMNFGDWANTDEAEAERVLSAALDAGINLVDTADVYSKGDSERILGKFLAKRADRDEIIVATKFHSKWQPGINSHGNSRHWITRAVEGSLQRLGLDHIDLYQVHRPAPATDIDETLSVLSDLVRAGKIRYFGTSTFSGHQLTEARLTAQIRGREYPISEQLPYSILAREAEREVLDVARKYRLGVLVWSPLAGGWLAGTSHANGNSRIGRQPERHTLDHEENVTKLEVVEKLQKIADEASITLPKLGLAFVLANRAVTTALLGPRTLEQLNGLLPAVDIELSADVLAAVDAVSFPGRTINPADTGYGRSKALELVTQQRQS